MTWLVLGVAIWSFVHFIPSLGKIWKLRFIEAYSQKTYTIIFSLTVITSIALMIIGWRTTAPSAIYLPPSWGGPVATVLMIIGFLLFGASHHQTYIKQFIRHPQLTGLIFWAIAHLISNGDSRSLILFAGLGLWAAIEIRLINARDGKWVKPEIPTIGVELKGHLISLTIFAVALILHPYFAGVSPIPR